MGYSKPTVQLDWILSDDPTKMTIVSAPNQLLGHVSDTAADPKIFNWMWNRVSHWITFLDNTFDSNGNNINAPNSTTITETVSPAASTVTLDAGGIKSWDASSNAIFSVTEPGVVTLGYNGNDIISLTAGVLSVATATAADLVKLHAVTPSAADLNILLGANGNGLIVADLTKLANIDASDAEIDQLDGVTVGGSSAGDITTIDDTQTLTNKTIDADNNTISNLEHGSEVDDPTTGVHGVGAGDIVGTGLEQTLTLKTLTSPKINENVVLTSTSTELNLLHGVSGLVQADFTKLAAINSSAANIDDTIINARHIDEPIDHLDITESFTVHPGTIRLSKTGFGMSAPGGDGTYLLFNLRSELLKSGTSTSTSTDKLIDSGGGFSATVEINDIVCNRTDDTEALVTAVDSDTSLSLDADIFTSSEDYEIFDKNSGNISLGGGGTKGVLNWDYSSLELNATINELTISSDINFAVLSGAPSTSTGKLYYHTGVGFKFWDGATWRTIDFT